jgi:hypothetical protein
MRACCHRQGRPCSFGPKKTVKNTKKQNKSFFLKNFVLLFLAPPSRFPSAQLFTEIAIVILMVGTLMGTIIQMGETMVSGLQTVSNDIPSVLTERSGSLIMVIMTIIITLPLACLRDLTMVGLPACLSARLCGCLPGCLQACAVSTSVSQSV